HFELVGVRDGKIFIVFDEILEKPHAAEEAVNHNVNDAVENEFRAVREEAIGKLLYLAAEGIEPCHLFSSVGDNELLRKVDRDLSAKVLVDLFILRIEISVLLNRLPDLFKLRQGLESPEDHEVVRAVIVNLREVPGGETVFDRELMEAEALGDMRHLVRVFALDINPDDGVGAERVENTKVARRDE